MAQVLARSQVLGTSRTDMALHNAPVLENALARQSFVSRGEILQLPAISIDLPRYNTVAQKSSHNSYQRDEALLDQLVYHRLRSLELDIHNGKTGWSKRSGDWYVYHADIADPQTTCHRLSDCLNELRAFHLANPQHEVVTVFIDLKDNFEGGRMPTDLDARILAHLPSSWILKPSDLLARCPTAGSLQAAVRSPCSWPYLSTIKGRFVFALTGGNVATTSARLNVYTSVGSRAGDRLAFVAPDLTNANQIFSRNHVVFFNLQSSDKGLAKEVYLSGFIGRVWGLNGSSDWNQARTLFAHHLGTNKVNFHQDPWASTHNALGWPFSCFFACAGVAEDIHVIGMRVNSEDIWGSNDHFRFQYEYNGSTSSAYWSASVSTPNSHVEDWAKGCLMARHTLASNSPYFAVCRAADDHRLRIQYRSGFGASTTAKDLSIFPSDTIDPESLTFIRLVVYNGGTCASGYGSQNGSSWILIGSKCFDYPLRRQGLAASSHGNDAVKFLFTNVVKNNTLYTKATLPYGMSVGTVRSYSVFDGVFP